MRIAARSARPSSFPVAEESGLILTLGRWAMDRAAQTLADWDKQIGETLPLYVGVNLSAIQVARDDIAAVVESALKSSGLTGDRLTLELTESSIVQDPARATRVFDALKALDATVAMDDFGTGYSSLAYLQRLPIDVLKIDKSFVSGMMVDPDAVAIVRAVLEPRRGARHVDDRRRHRNGRAGDHACDARLRVGPGLLFRQAARGRGRARLLEVAPAAEPAVTRSGTPERHSGTRPAEPVVNRPATGEWRAMRKWLVIAVVPAACRSTAAIAQIERGLAVPEVARVATHPRARFPAVAGTRRPAAGAADSRNARSSQDVAPNATLGVGLANIYAKRQRLGGVAGGRGRRRGRASRR